MKTILIALAYVLGVRFFNARGIESGLLFTLWLLGVPLVAGVLMALGILK